MPGFINKTLHHICLTEFWISISTAQNMKFFIKDFFIKCDQIRRTLRIWSHLRKKSLMENFVFCAVQVLSIPWFQICQSYPRFLKKCAIIEAWQDSEYSQSSEYGRVLNVPGLQKVLKKTNSTNSTPFLKLESSLPSNFCSLLFHQIFLIFTDVLSFLSFLLQNCSKNAIRIWNF